MDLSQKIKHLFDGKSAKIAAGVLLVLLVFFLHFRTAFARFAWNKFGAGPIAIVLDSTDSTLAFTIGTSAFGTGVYNTQLAEMAFHKAIAINPKIFWGHYELARIFFVEDRLPEALNEINTELSVDPDNFRAFYVRGLIYAYSNNLPAAEADYKKFISWAPSEWAGYNDLAWVLGEEKKYAEAELILQKAFANAVGAQENPWLWNNLGVQQLNLKDFNDAITSFKKAQNLAQVLTPETWHLAYPGDDPSSSSGGITSFQNVVKVNLLQAEAAI